MTPDSDPTVEDPAPEGPAPIGRLLPALASAASLSVIFVAALSIPLEAAETLEMTRGQTTGWIIAVYGGSAVLSIALSLICRQPLLFTGNIFILILIVRLGTDFRWSEIIGAAMVAGAVVLALGPLGLTRRLSLWLPAPIVFGLLAGAVLPFLIDMFGVLDDEPLLVGGAVIVYLVAKRALEPRVPAILPALAAAVLLAALTGSFQGVLPAITLPAPELTAPVFSAGAIASLTPVMVVLIAVQANAPSVVFLREQHYEPGEQIVSAVSGAGTMVGSLLGPTGISLSLPATALVAGPDAGPHSSRYWAALLAAGSAMVIAALAGFAVEVAGWVPRALLLTGVGLAVLTLLSSALRRATEGPLIWGPLFSFVIALSDMSLFGLGEFFWAIAAGVAVSLLLERSEWKRMGQTSTG